MQWDCQDVCYRRHMARAKKPAKVTKSTARRRAKPARSRADAERELLALAARLSTTAADAEPPPTSLRAALDELLTAYAADGALAAALIEARRGARGDKRASLALAWAREQLRLAIEELLAREAKADRLRAPLALDALAWLVLVAAESVIHEPPAAAVDRTDTLLALVHGPGD
ncbi:MAG: hypothetical protein HYR51_01465 [Candidatus Rokubacteria bacterium]|nr:hypothetical protein [Candidatus Rokubacteria bacterium]